MDKRRFINTRLFFAILLLFMFSKTCFSGDLISGSFDSSSPAWDRIKDGGSSQSSDCDTVAFDSWNDDMLYQTFEVLSSVDEDFTATVVGSKTTVDTLLALYCKTFDPNQPDSNLIAINDDGAGYPHPKLEGIALKANTVYTLVITKYSGLNPFGSFEIQLGGNFSTDIAEPSQTNTPTSTLTPTPVTINPTPTPVTIIMPTPTPVTINPTPTLIPQSTPTPITTVMPTASPEPSIVATATPDETEDDEPDEMAPLANFIVDQAKGPVPLIVNFTDISENNPSAWLWDFGEGSASIDQNPSHSYLAEGIFSVTLTVTNEFGENTLTKENIIEVLPPVPSGKSFTFKCDKVLQIGAASLETLILELGETETCLLKLTNLEPGKPIEIGTFARNGFKVSTNISPSKGVPDLNGELEVTITAVRKGIDWIAWAVPNESGQFEFGKIAYDSGLAWGMFVEVK